MGLNKVFCCHLLHVLKKKTYMIFIIKKKSLVLNISPILKVTTLFDVNYLLSKCDVTVTQFIYGIWQVVYEVVSLL